MKKTFNLHRITAIALVLITLCCVISGCNSCDDNDNPIDAAGYTVTVKTVGGMLVAGVTVTLSDGNGKEVANEITDSNGSIFAALNKDEYFVTVSDLKPGFHAPEEPIKTSVDGGNVVVTLTTSVITDPEPDSHTQYSIGEVMYDFSILKDGGEVKLSQLLETRKLIVINFWAEWCSPCKSEFPAIEEAYAFYNDSVEIIAFNISDTAEVCRQFKENNGYTFNMIPDIGLSQKTQNYGQGSIPYTLFIDRYGVFVNYVFGAETSTDAWLTEFEGYTSDNYVQHPGTPISDVNDDESQEEVLKPDVSMPDSSEIENAINGSGFNFGYTASASETIWPWVLSDDKQSIVPSNIGKDSTTAIINTEVELSVGQVVAFDYKASIERDEKSVYDYDLFSVYVDGYLMQKFYGKHTDYETVYVYTPDSDGKHTVTLYYAKDDSDMYLPDNTEYVNVKNMRIVTVDEMKKAGGSLLVLRTAAKNVNTADNPKTSYTDYAEITYNKNDGYYHIGTESGPLLLCDLVGGTAWSPESINTLAYAGYLVIGGVDYQERITEYTWQQTHSTVPYVPVDMKLADMLDLIVSSIGNGPNHDNEWLELCFYFDHYGNGEGITKVFDVRQGISVDSAFPAKIGTNHVVVKQVLVPCGQYYEFIPDKDGVYSFYSVNPGEGEENMIDTYAWMVLPDGTLRGNFVDENDFYGDDENFHINYSCKAGEKYYIVVAFNSPDTLGEFDFKIEYIGETYDEFIPCTRHYVTNLEGTQLFVDRYYDLHAELGKDGYYHQVLSYNSDGSPVLDYSEHGYIYVDFTGIPCFMSFLLYDGQYVSLKDYIELNGKAENIGFDFTNQVDIEGNSLASLGNHQKEMEKYLALALSSDNTEQGFVKADKKLVEILENTLILLYGENNVDDQWLMFCSFYHHR